MSSSERCSAAAALSSSSDSPDPRAALARSSAPPASRSGTSSCRRAEEPVPLGLLSAPDAASAAKPAASSARARGSASDALVLRRPEGGASGHASKQADCQLRHEAVDHTFRSILTTITTIMTIAVVS